VANVCAIIYSIVYIVVSFLVSSNGQQDMPAVTNIIVVIIKIVL